MALDFAIFSDILVEDIFGFVLTVYNLEFRQSPLVGPVTARLGCKKTCARTKVDVCSTLYL